MSKTLISEVFLIRSRNCYSSWKTEPGTDIQVYAYTQEHSAEVSPMERQSSATRKRSRNNDFISFPRRWCIKLPNFALLLKKSLLPDPRSRYFSFFTNVNGNFRIPFQLMTFCFYFCKKVVLHSLDQGRNAKSIENMFVFMSHWHNSLYDILF